jgi:hypothetical protein
MHERGCDVQEAMQWAAKYHKEVEARFLENMNRLPSFYPSVDADLHEYLFQLANWPRGNDCWSFESGRYFGSKGLDVQKTRKVPLLAKVSVNRLLKRELVEVPVINL